MNKVQKTIRLAPFKDKYREYLIKSQTCYINVLEGAIRSGKTIVNLIGFSRYLDNHKTGGIFIASSTTSGLAWEILAECRGHNSLDGKYGADQGFGLLYLFKGRCRRTKVKGSPALEIINKYKQKCSVVFVGAKNKGCVESVRGLSIAGWIATELENHSTEEGDDFIGFMFGRMMGAYDGKCFIDLNPSYPSNKMYTKYLDVFEKSGNENYNYLKCGIFDNSAFTKEQIEQTLALYTDKTSVMYKRDILGERAAASGCIFSQFAMNCAYYTTVELPTAQNGDFITLGIDFGGNGSNTAFVATYISKDYKKVIPIADDEIDMSNQDNATVGVYKKRLTDFINLVEQLNLGIPIRAAYADCADTVMVNETILLMRTLGKAIKVYNCAKLTIKDRIKLKSAMISTGHWQVYKNCKYIIKSTSEQVWNPDTLKHPDERLDDGSCDIDIADAEEYSWSWAFAKLNKANAIAD